MGEETRRIVTARKRSLGQGNIVSSVCQEFCSQGGSASVHAGYPPGADTPGTRSKHPPPPGVDNPLGPGTLPKSRPPREQTHPSRSRHPRKQTPLCSACWEIRSTSGRYASYWNAILYVLNFLAK